MTLRHAHAPGRCRACRRNLEPIRLTDEFGHVTGDTPDGRCLNPECHLAYAVQPWSKSGEERMADLAEAVREIAAPLLTTAAD